MICPVCGTHLPEGTVVCTACHAVLNKKSSVPRFKQVYCRNCGALIPDGALSCPRCGLPAGSHFKPDANLETEPVELIDDEFDFVDTYDNSSDQTNRMPRLKSAIPSPADIESEMRAKDPRPLTRPFLYAALASLMLIVGVTLVLWHPWNPNAYSSRPSEGADTSKAGFPGEITSLAGQDSSQKPKESPVSGDQATFEKLMSVYDAYGKLSTALDENQKTFDEVALSNNLEARKEGQKQCKNIAIKISNTIAELNDIDVSSGTYAKDLEHMTRLGNLLRNRCDALVKAWGFSVKSPSPQEDKEKIMAPITDPSRGVSATSNAQLFDEKYKSWKPNQTKS